MPRKFFLTYWRSWPSLYNILNFIRSLFLILYLLGVFLTASTKNNNVVRYNHNILIAITTLFRYPTTACAENGSIGEMLDRLESPVKMVCAIPRTGLQEAYRHLMNVVLPVIAANATKRRDICLPKLWIEVKVFLL